MDEYKELEKPYYNNGRTAKEQMHVHLRDRYDEVIFTIDRFIIDNNMENEDALAFKQMILNFCANLLGKNFQNKDVMRKYFTKLFGELNTKFLFEDATRQRQEANKTALVILLTGMIFGRNCDNVDN